MKYSKIKLIYIVSNGRSGSTLLDMLIGKHSKCYTLGEFQMLPIDFEYNTQPCGCGESLKNCHFWSQIYLANEKIIDEGVISRFRNFGAGKLLRWNELKSVYLNKPERIEEKQEIYKYGQENYTVFTSVLNKVREEMDVEYLVDASKDLYRLKWLAQSELFDISVLHIIKSPEAFVYSMRKSEMRFFPKMKRTIRMSLRWVIENHFINKVCSKYIVNGRYTKVKYEDLASNTQDELKNLFSKINLTYEKNILEGGFFHENHAISGNKMRFKSSVIKLDQKWKSELSLFQRILIKAITFFHKGGMY